MPQKLKKINFFVGSAALHSSAPRAPNGMIFIEKQKKIIENMFRVSEGVNPSMVGGGGALGHAGVHKVLKSSVLCLPIAKPVLGCM